jgi:hypothetical protein
VRVCESFFAFYELKGLLVLVLRPHEVLDVAGYRSWLQQLTQALPAFIRLLVLDEAEHPAYAALASSAPPRIVSVRAALDMPGALQQLSDAAGGLDTPGGQFRDAFVRTGNTLGAGQLDHALTLGAAAVAVAQAHGLWHLAVPVHVALGVALLGAKRGAETLAQYDAAEAAAQRGMTLEDPLTSDVCKTLYLQSRVGHGAALIALGSFSEAAELYEQISPLMAAAGDLPGWLDCQRLASFCHERAGAHDRAWQTGMQGLEVARSMTESARATSSLPYLADALRRVSVNMHEGAAKQLERELAALQPTAAERA